MGPKYREARPKLDLREIQAAFFDDRRVCWFEGPNFLRGEVLLLGTPGDNLTIHYMFSGRGFPYVAATDCFALDPAPTRLNPKRHFFRCPSCNQRKMTMYFKSRWACGECHALRYRTQSVPGPQRIYERNLCRRDFLHASLAEGRPHRMRNTTFERLCNELEELEEWLQQNPPKLASARQRHVVTHEWKRASELGEPLWSIGYVRNGNSIQPSPW